MLTTQIGDRVKQMVETLLTEAECTTIAIETDVCAHSGSLSSEAKAPTVKDYQQCERCYGATAVSGISDTQESLMERAPVEPLVFSGDGRWCAVGSNQAVC